MTTVVLDGLGELLAGAATLARTLAVRQVASKATQDYVSNVDHELDAYLAQGLRALTPSIPIFSEERSFEREQLGDRYWLVDPLDGTHNFIAKLELSAISVALMAGDAPVVGGVVHITSGDLYLAEHQRGATQNGERLRLDSEPMELVGVSSGALDALVEHPEAYPPLRALGKLRNLGSQALHLCLVARGSLAATISREARLWDDAAGRLIAEEAGARYRSFSRAATPDDPCPPLKSICAHPALYDRMARLAETLFVA